MPSITPKTYYCVYWYPTIFHKEKEHRKIKPHLIDLSDQSLYKQYYLTIEEVRDPKRKGAIDLHYYLSTEKKDLSALKADKKCVSFVFRYIRQSRNGFVVYSYDRDALLQNYWSQFGETTATKIKGDLANWLKQQGNPKPTDDEIKNYPIDRILLSCYHHSKNFYHEHEIQEEADGKLEAYFYVLNKNNKRQYLTVEPQLFPKNHDVINWFIEQFESQFVKHAKQVSDTYRFCKNQLKRYEKYLEKSKEILDGQDKEKIDRLNAVLKWECDCLEKYNRSNLIELVNTAEYNKFMLDRMQKLQNVDVEEVKKEIEEFKEKIHEGRIIFLQNRLEILESICGNAMTEYTYCKTLVESKYNEKYDYRLPVSEAEIKELIDYYEEQSQCDNELIKKDNSRKKAFNIRNCIRYIESVRQKCTLWENELSRELIKQAKNVSDSIKTISESNQIILHASQESSINSEFLGWVSVALGFLSVGLALRNPQQQLTASPCAFVFIIIGFLLFLIGLIKKLLTNSSNDSKK